MTNRDSGEFFRRLLGLAELFDAKFSEAKSTLYFEALRDLPLETVIAAMNQAARACSFMPRPAELRSLAFGDDDTRVESAWLAMRDAMRIAGAYASLIVADAALADAIVSLFGGWAEACAVELSPEMWAAKRKEFARVYRVMIGRQVSGGRYLPGVAEQKNAGRREYQRFVPVHRLDASGVSAPLSLEAAEQARVQLAADRHAFSRLESETILRLIPKSVEESA